jgi:RNA polymerase sigma-70 factor (ECF subfamily)
LGVVETEGALAESFRSEWGRIVATLIKVTGDWDLAEECAQEAFAQALKSWPADGVPDRPGAWLTTVARHRAVDRLRRRSNEASKLEEVAVMAERADAMERVDDGGISDDRLRLIFTCCHPALALESRTALTLRTLAGLSTVEIARAFLVPESTMAKRLVRAKHKIRDAKIPYRVPPPALLPERMNGVLAVLYLLFNEGYAASDGAHLVRHDLCDEAIRLGRLLVDLMPDAAEATGLLALLLFHDARRTSRVDAAGDLITLEDQDRSLWNQDQIAQGVRLLAATSADAELGQYRIQAAIAACHVASTAEHTDWAQIASLYGLLELRVPSPVIALNRAVAIAMADGPLVGLELVQRLETSGALGGYYLLPATRADLERRLERPAAAAVSYRRALELAPTEPERRYLRRRLAEVEGTS